MKIMRTKHQIYAEILQHGLLLIRSHSSEQPTCLVTADFLHNIPQYILREEFDDLDFFFLNIEVGSYVSYCENLKVPVDAVLLSLVDELRKIVLEDVQTKLKQ